MAAIAAAYLPSGPRVVALSALILAVTVLGNLANGRLRPVGAARAAAWLIAIATIVGVERLNRDEPAGFRMLAIIGVGLWAMKAVVLVESRASGQQPLPPLRWLGFVAGWPGMQPRLFADTPGRRRQEAWPLIVLGLRRLALGVGLVAVARVIWVATGSRLAATVPLLPGLSLILHFGIFNLVAGGWRAAGVNAAPIFRAPLQSQSLTEFWGRRWNLAFSEMTALAVFRPLSASAGQQTALLASFAFSGLLHEMAISLPVRAGYGLPMLYFIIHGGLMLTERALAARGHALRGWFGRGWTIFWLVLPLPILFHPPFLRGVVWPIIGIGG